MKVAHALWVCLTIAIVTSGHETAVESLDVEEAAPPLFKRGRGHMHQQQPCCMQTPIPDSCSCYVGHVPLSEMKVEKPAEVVAEEAAKKKAADDKALAVAEGTAPGHVDPQLALRAKMKKLKTEAKTTPFIPMANMGARVMRKAKAFKKVDDQFRVVGGLATGNKAKLVRLEKNKFNQKAEYSLIKAAMPEVKRQIRLAKKQLREQEASRRKFVRRARHAQQRMRQEHSIIEEDSSALRQDKTDMQDAALRLSRATKRSNGNEELKETEKRAKEAKAADAKKATAAHKAGDKLVAARAKVKKAMNDKEAAKEKAKNTETKMAAETSKENKLERKVGKAKGKVKQAKGEVKKDQAKADKTKSAAKAAGAKVTAGKKKLKAMAKAEAKKANAALKDKKKLKKTKKNVAKLKSTVKVLNDKEKSTAAKAKKSAKLADRDNAKVKAELRKIKILRTRISRRGKNIGVQKAALKTELVKTTKDHKADNALQAKMEADVAGEKTRKETYDKLLGAEKELMVVPAKVKDASDKLASPIRQKCAKIERTASALQSKVAALTKEVHEDKKEFSNLRNKMKTPGADEWKDILAKGGCSVTDVDSPYVVQAFEAAMEALQASAQKSQEQILETAKRVVGLEQQAEDAGKNAINAEVKLVDVKLGSSVEQVVKEEVDTSSDQTKKIPGTKAAPETAKRALAQAAKKEERIAADKEKAQAAQAKDVAKDKRKVEASKQNVKDKLKQIKQMETDGIGMANATAKVSNNNTGVTGAGTTNTVSGISKSDSDQFHADAQQGKTLDEKMKAMLQSFVSDKLAECKLRLKAPMPAAGGTYEQKVKKQLNCHRESKVKGEVKRREMRVQLGQKVDAMSTCVQKAFLRDSSRAKRLGTKVSAAQVKLGTLQATVKVEKIKLAGCRKELQEASRDGVSAGDVIIKLKAKMSKLKNSASAANDKYMTTQKKDTDAEIAVKSKMRMHSAKLNVLSANIFKTDRKLAHEKLSMGKDEKKLSTVLTVASKLLKETAKQKYITRKIGEITGTTNNSVKKGDLTTDKLKLKAKLDVMKVKGRKQSIKAENKKVKKLSDEGKKAKDTNKAAEKTLAGAKKKEKAATNKEKKEEGTAKKVKKAIADDKKKIINLQGKEKKDDAKIENERSKVAKESSKIAPLKEKAKLAEKKAERLESKVDKVMKNAKAQEDIPTKKRMVDDMKREVKGQEKKLKRLKSANKAAMDDMKFEHSKVDGADKQISDLKSFLDSYYDRQTKMTKRSTELQKLLQKNHFDKIQAKANLAKQEAITNAMQLSRAKLGEEVKHDRDELTDEVQNFDRRHDDAKQKAAHFESLSSRLTLQIEHDENQLAAHKQLLVGEMKAETDLRKHAVDADANATAIERSLRDQNEKALEATTTASTFADSEVSYKTKVHDLREPMKPVWAAQQHSKEADGKLVAAKKVTAATKEALTAATKDMKHTAADRAFAEKIAVEHLTGHVQGALLEAARASHARATKALAQAEKAFKEAKQGQKEAAATASAADKKSAALTQTSAAPAKKLADATASLIATTAKLRNTKVEAVLARHTARKSQKELKDAKEFLYEIHKNATKAESIVMNEQAEVKQLNTKILLGQESKRRYSSQASKALAHASVYFGKEISGREALLHVSKLKLPSPTEVAGIPDSESKKATAKTTRESVEKASNEAKKAVENAKDATGALESAKQTQTAGHEAAHLKQKIESAQNEAKKKGANVEAKQIKLKQLKKDHLRKQQEAKRAQGTAKKLEAKSKKEYDKTEKEISQLSNKMSKAKADYQRAKKEEAAANKQAADNADNVAQKAKNTMKAKQKLQDVTKENEQLEHAKKGDK